MSFISDDIFDKAFRLCEPDEGKRLARQGVLQRAKNLITEDIRYIGVMSSTGEFSYELDNSHGRLLFHIFRPTDYQNGRIIPASRELVHNKFSIRDGEPNPPVLTAIIDQMVDRLGYHGDFIVTVVSGYYQGYNYIFYGPEHKNVAYLFQPANAL